jgi:hypothetical protein
MKYYFHNYMFTSAFILHNLNFCLEMAKEEFRARECRKFNFMHKHFKMQL